MANGSLLGLLHATSRLLLVAGTIFARRDSIGRKRCRGNPGLPNQHAEREKDDEDCFGKSFHGNVIGNLIASLNPFNNVIRFRESGNF
jgi:hypothetical protein